MLKKMQVFILNLNSFFEEPFMKQVVGIFFVLIVTSSIAYSLGFNPRSVEIISFYPGHTHKGESTNGAPGHSGRTDRYGCHNKSVPYHCH
jgi:hypothetical protein